LSKRLILAICGVLAIALVTAGCGGGDDETTATLTKAQFIKQADGICSAAEDELDSKFEKL
jgi:hypothetical protein